MMRPWPAKPLTFLASGVGATVIFPLPKRAHYTAAELERYALHGVPPALKPTAPPLFLSQEKKDYDAAFPCLPAGGHVVQVAEPVIDPPSSQALIFATEPMIPEKTPAGKFEHSDLALPSPSETLTGKRASPSSNLKVSATRLSAVVPAVGCCSGHLWGFEMILTIGASGLISLQSETASLPCWSRWEVEVSPVGACSFRVRACCESLSECCSQSAAATRRHSASRLQTSCASCSRMLVMTALSSCCCWRRSLDECRSQRSSECSV